MGYPNSVICIVALLLSLNAAMAGDYLISKDATPQFKTMNQDWAFLWHWMNLPEHKNTRDEILEEPLFKDFIYQDESQAKLKRPWDTGDADGHRINRYSSDKKEHYLTKKQLEDQNKMREIFSFVRNKFCEDLSVEDINKDYDLRVYCDEDTDDDDRKKIWQIRTENYLKKVADPSHLKSDRAGDDRKLFYRHLNHAALFVQNIYGCSSHLNGSPNQETVMDLMSNLAEIQKSIGQSPENDHKIKEKQNRTVERLKLLPKVQETPTPNTQEEPPEPNQATQLPSLLESTQPTD